MEKIASGRMRRAAWHFSRADGPLRGSKDRTCNGRAVNLCIADADGRYHLLFLVARARLSAVSRLRSHGYITTSVSVGMDRR